MEKWHLLTKKKILSTKWLSLFVNSYRLPNGNVVDDYFHIDKQDCVVVIAVKEDLIGVVKQYRRGVDEILYELPAGLIDNNHTPIETALRELQEETGYVGKAKHLIASPTQPAFISMKTNFVLVQITEFIGTNFGIDESIEFEFMSYKKIKEMIKDRKITDLSFIAGMYLYAELIKNDSFF